MSLDTLLNCTKKHPFLAATAFYGILTATILYARNAYEIQTITAQNEGEYFSPDYGNFQVFSYRTTEGRIKRIKTSVPKSRLVQDATYEVTLKKYRHKSDNVFFLNQFDDILSYTQSTSTTLAEKELTTNPSF